MSATALRASRAFRAWVTLLRPANALTAGLGVWLGHACLPGPMAWASAALGSLAMALLAAAGNAHNDLLDLPVDRVNRPDRPLPSGRLSPRVAAWTAGVLYLVAFAVAFAVSRGAGNLAVGMGILLALYNLKLKALPLVGNLAVSLLCALAVYLPELPGAPRHTGIAVLFAFLTTLARELAKDAEDMAGDRSAGWRTFPLAFGEGATRALVAVLLIATLLLLPVPLRLGYPSAYGVVAVVPGLLLISMLIGLPKEPTPWGKVQRRLKWTMLAGMAALLVGVLQ